MIFFTFPEPPPPGCCHLKYAGKHLPDEIRRMQGLASDADVALAIYTTGVDPWRMSPSDRAFLSGALDALSVKF